MKEWSSVLFCGAFDGETDILARIAGLKVYNVGIGMHDPIFNLQRYLSKNDKIKSIMFLGSAGAYPHSGLHLGDIVASNKFLYRDIAEIKNMAKVPDVVTRHVLTDIDERLEKMIKKFDFPWVITNSMNYITLVDLPQEELIGSLFDVGVENMEAFSIAYVANRFSIKFTSLYYVTNIVGANGSLDWARNWREGSNVLQKKVIRYLQGR
ncbi:MAG: hypothetical protein KDK36_08500 [Leptospiraceae bacterium]|nr:hypothetical protein [Leptospiraceae bacterium]